MKLIQVSFQNDTYIIAISDDIIQRHFIHYSNFRRYDTAAFHEKAFSFLYSLFTRSQSVINVLLFYVIQYYIHNHYVDGPSFDIMLLSWLRLPLRLWSERFQDIQSVLVSVVTHIKTYAMVVFSVESKVPHKPNSVHCRRNWGVRRHYLWGFSSLPSKRSVGVDNYNWYCPWCITCLISLSLWCIPCPRYENSYHIKIANM